MKRLSQLSGAALLIATATTFASQATPVFAQNAQVTAPNVTRADLVKELQELQALGYEPSREGDYPADLQAALKQLAATHGKSTRAKLASAMRRAD